VDCSKHLAERGLMLSHKDTLWKLNKEVSLKTKLVAIHGVIRSRFEFIQRISVAVYDVRSKLVRTFLSSSNTEDPFEFYTIRMDQSPSLLEIWQTGLSSLVSDLSIFQKAEKKQTTEIPQQESCCSYTTTITFDENLKGFLFFDSYSPDSFSDAVCNDLDIFVHVIGLMIGREIGSIRATMSVLKMASIAIHLREVDAKNHLNRVSGYSRIIARAMSGADKHELTDADVSRLHMIHSVMQNFGFESFEGMNVLKQLISTDRLELNDGFSVKGGETPLESRIVAIADLFDALTALQPPENAWRNEEALTMLRRISKTKRDQDCVSGLGDNIVEVEKIKTQFSVPSRKQKVLDSDRVL
jgi:HD-GYP domain-containing protein (c-di-GMP phosphodiesterase class II)